MNKLEGFINSLNDWREKLMNEERKRDLQAVLQAGKKVIAKLKNYRDDKIVAYDGADCYFTDDEPDIYSDGFEITPEGFTDTDAVNKEKAKGKIQDFVSGIKYASLAIFLRFALAGTDLPTYLSKSFTYIIPITLSISPS